MSSALFGCSVLLTVLHARVPPSFSLSSIPTVDVHCSAGDLPTYLNTPAVKQALHVVDIPWVICTGNMSYQREYLHRD